MENIKDKRTARHAMKFIIMFGVVSLLADMTYEGARSITGPFLAILGANAVVVGLVSGIGEFIGYTLRIASGILTDKTKRYLRRLSSGVDFRWRSLVSRSGESGWGHRNP